MRIGAPRKSTLRSPPDMGRSAPGPAIPRDLKVAIAFMRAGLCRSISIADLARHCGVAERTLNQHFRAFFGLSPGRYLRRLRFTAAREALLAGEPGISVTEIAERFGFNHLGRFAEHYRKRFGESPSTTLRRGRTAALGERGPAEDFSPRAHDGSRHGRRIALPSRDRPSIAVLPCRMSAHELTHHWLAENIAEAIAAALGPIRSLAVVIPRSLHATRRNPQSLAQDLNARYYLTGRIVRVGSRLRVILRLVKSASEHHVWGDSFDGDSDQPLELQDRIVTSVVHVISTNIRGAEIDRVQRARVQDLDSYGLAMRAFPLICASQPDSTRRALELLHRAVEFDPDYGLATALLAWCHAQLVMYTGTPAPAEEKLRAVQLMHRAAALDDDDPLVLAARCAVHTMAGDFETAESLIARALASDPFFGWAWGRSGWLHSYMGHSETAIVHFRRALALDPNRASRANTLAGIGSACFGAGRYDESAFWLQSALLENPGMWWANRSLSVSHARLGDRLKALDSLDRLLRSCPDLTVGQVVSAVPFRRGFLERLGDGLSGLGLPP